MTAARKVIRQKFPRLLLPVGLLLLILWRPEVISVLVGGLLDAWYEAGVYVALTLSLFYFLESKVSLNFSGILAKKDHVSLLTATLIGAIPGCGGSIYVVLNFLRGKASFGALVATLVSTMGDSAFLLLSRNPLRGVLLISIQIVAGFITGLIIDRGHGVNFLSRPHEEEDLSPEKEEEEKLSLGEKIVYSSWYLLLIPAAILALYTASGGLLATTWVSTLFLWIGVSYTGLAVIKWVFVPEPNEEEAMRSSRDEKRYAISRKVFHETCFVVVWVFIAQVFYILISQVFALNIVGFFQQYPLLAPLIGIAIGFIPGCGPQILVTGLYLSGVIPFSAQLGNAISTDGDALFPALRLSPKAVIIATFYSAIPAFVLAYGWNFLFE